MQTFEVEILFNEGRSGQDPAQGPDGVSADDDEAARKLVANERRKLSATYLNGVAVAVFAVGGFAPFISTVLASSTESQSPLLVLGVMAVCWIVSGTIHSAARASLKGLRP